MKIKTVYVANDGKEFTNQEACKDWENSQELREALSNSWYGTPNVKHEWITKVASDLIRNYHIIKRTNRG